MLHNFSKIPPCKVLVIGAGVAGLSAIATVCNEFTLMEPRVKGLTLFPG